MTVVTDGPVVWVHAIDGRRIGALGTVLSLEIDKRLQSTETIKFAIDAADRKAGLVDIERIVEVEGTQYRIKETTKVRDGARRILEVVGEALWCDLLDGLFFVQEPATVSGTVSVGLEYILDLNGWLGDWTVGTVEGDGGSWALEFAETISTLAAIRKWATLVGREVVFDTVARTVSLVFAEGETTNRTFRYGRDITKVSRTVEPPEATRLYAYGKDWLSFASINGGKPYVENLDYYVSQGFDEEIATEYGRHLLWTATEYTNATQLFDAATERLAKLSQPRVAYSLDVADFAELTGSTTPVALGDTVRVVDLELGINIDTRVVRLVRNPFVPNGDSIELSFLFDGLDVSNTGSVGSSGSGGSAVDIFTSVNAASFTVSTSLYTPHSVTLTLPSVTTFTAGYQVNGTATGSGQFTAQLYWGTEPVGALARQSFGSGPFHMSVNDVLTVDGSRSLNMRINVNSGSGTVAVSAEASRLFAIVPGGAAGAGSSDPSVDVNDPVLTTPITVTETVTITNPP